MGSRAPVRVGHERLDDSRRGGARMVGSRTPFWTDVDRGTNGSASISDRSGRHYALGYP
jgi:hypothetical protein